MWLASWEVSGFFQKRWKLLELGCEAEGGEKWILINLRKVRGPVTELVERLLCGVRKKPMKKDLHVSGWMVVPVPRAGNSDRRSLEGDHNSCFELEFESQEVCGCRCRILHVGHWCRVS